MVALTKFFPMRARAFLVYWRDEIWETMVAVGEFKVDIITLRGRMPGSEEEITMLYVGRKLNYSHFTKKFFVDPETVKSKKSNLFSFRKAMKAEEGTTDVTFFDVGWPYTERVKKSGDYLELPDWVCMEVALAETWDGTVQNFRKTMRKNIRRLIRKNNYRWPMKARFCKWSMTMVQSRQVFIFPWVTACVFWQPECLRLFSRSHPSQLCRLSITSVWSMRSKKASSRSTLWAQGPFPPTAYSNSNVNGAQGSLMNSASTPIYSNLPITIQEQQNFVNASRL